MVPDRVAPVATVVTVWLYPETHTKRQATQHDCLPSLLGDWGKGIVIVYDEGKNILYWSD